MTAGKVDTARMLAGAAHPKAVNWSYGIAHGGKTLMWTASDLYFTFYMTEICDVPLAHTGVVIGCSFLFAALADLLLSRTLGRTARSFPSPGTTQAIGALASAVALLLFATASFAPVSMRLAACIVALFGFRAAYALLDVPQNALLALATRTDRERANLTAIRNVAGAIARTGLALAFVPMMTGHAPRVSAFSFLGLVLALGSLTIIGALLLRRAVDARPAPCGPDREPNPARTGRSLFLPMFVLTFSTTVFMQIEPYLATYGIADRLAGGIFMGAIALGSAVSQPFWLSRSGTRRFSTLLDEALVVLVLGGFLLVILPRDTLPGSAGAGLAYGIGSGGVLFALWSGIARQAARGGAVAIIGRFTAAAKLAQGLAVLAVGLLLDARALRGDGYDLAMIMSGTILLGAGIVVILARTQHRQSNAIIT